MGQCGVADSPTAGVPRGMSPWILKDFRSPRRQLGGVQDGWNRKGLISELGEEKLAFEVLAEWYAAKKQGAED